MDITQVKPTREKLIVELETPDKEINGLIIPDSSQTHGNIGKVISAGPDCETRPGEKIIFGDYDDRDTYDQDNKRYIFLWQKDVMCEMEGY